VNPFTRWWEVTRREFLAGLRRPPNWVLLVILGLMALGLSDGSVTVSSGESGVGGERPHITSVYNQSMIQPTLEDAYLLLAKANGKGKHGNGQPPRDVEAAEVDESSRGDDPDAGTDAEPRS